jgi:diguanylate cyclase (GGDEF)-like protein
VAESLRAEDTLFRYGGEEFTVLLPGCHTAEAMGVADKVRLAVSALELAYMGKPLGRLSLSIGVGCSQDAAGPEELIRQADEALYEAKRLGRDRCVNWQEMGHHEAA